MSHAPLTMQRVTADCNAILQAMRNGHVTAAAISAQTGISRKLLSNRMEKLKGDGKIEMMCYATWRTTDKIEYVALDLPPLVKSWFGYPT
jgi:GTP-sensing pleiotropic transcriptional regulator CodY